MSSNSCDQTDGKSTSPSPPSTHPPYYHNPHHRLHRHPYPLHPYPLHPLHRHDFYPQPPVIETIYPPFSPRYGPHIVGSQLQPYKTDPPPTPLYYRDTTDPPTFYSQNAARLPLPPPPPPLLPPPTFYSQNTAPLPPPLYSSDTTAAPPPSTFYSQNTTTPSSSSRTSNDQKKINILDMKSILTKKGDRYECPFCDNTFMYRISLITHLKRCRKKMALDHVQLNEQQSTNNSLERSNLKSRHQETFKLASLLINQQKEQLQEKDAEITRLKKFVEKQNINSSNGIVSLSTPQPPGCSTNSSTAKMQNMEHLSIEQKQAIQVILNTPQTANITTPMKKVRGRPAKVTNTSHKTSLPKKRRGRPAKITETLVKERLHKQQQEKQQQEKQQQEKQQQPHSGVSIMSGHDSEKAPRLIECTQCQKIRFRPSPWNHGIFATICSRCLHT